MSVAIPNRPVFRSQDVCEIAEVQPYVLRTWETEFPDLGVAKAAGGPRIYRRADVERVLQIKHLLFIDGLTISGVKRRLGEVQTARPEPATTMDADVAALVDGETRQHLKRVRSGLQWILGLLVGEGASASEFVLTPSTAGVSGRGSKSKKTARVARAPKAAKSARASRSVAKAAKGHATKTVTKGAAKKGSKKR